MKGLLQWTRAELLHLGWKLGRYTPPDRRVLVGSILPALAKDPDNRAVLFVGVQWYTSSYPSIFEPGRLTTIDMKPELAQFGAPDHAIASVCDLESAFPSRTFDAIVMNGVIGFGLDAPDAIDRALAACAKKLRPGGALVIGLNEHKPNYVDPTGLPSSRLFEPHALPLLTRPTDPSVESWSETKLVVEVPFRERSHTFLFWRSRAPAAADGA